MPIKKASKTHTSARKKNVASSAKSGRAKKTASSASSMRTKKTTSKRSQPATKSKSTKPKKTKKNGERPAWLKKRDELTVRAFQMTYEAYQQGKFHRIL
ncbi:MAG TPA: hypothetical protein VFY67_04960 [Pyrinomonadaceae bacterium]|nr:hypothetical protein [Pyrinomonadaceae bacterium]